jgi:hypothetical protein
VLSEKNKAAEAGASETFNFKLKTPVSKSAGKDGQAGGGKGKKGDQKPARGKEIDAVISGKLATRELRKRRQQQSLSQISGLNALAVQEEQKKVDAGQAERSQNQQRAMMQQGQRHAGETNAGPVPMRGPMSGNAAGVGGGQQADMVRLLDFELDVAGQVPAGIAGGLSVAFEIPTGGQTLQFATTGDNPKLELAMRPRESIQQGLNLLWTVAWLAVGCGVIVAVSRAGTLDLLKRHLAKALVGLGLITFLLLPGGLSTLGFLLFLSGLLVVAFQNRAATEAEGVGGV